MIAPKKLAKNLASLTCTASLADLQEVKGKQRIASTPFVSTRNLFQVIRRMPAQRSTQNSVREESDESISHLTVVCMQKTESSRDNQRMKPIRTVHWKDSIMEFPLKAIS